MSDPWFADGTLVHHTSRIKPERHWLVRGSDAGSGGLLALSQVGG